MAGESFQNEIPPSRVNIRYVKDTGGAREEVELPLKLLVTGDFTMRQDATPLEDRKKISIDKNNFKDVFREQHLGLDLVVPDTLQGGDNEMAVKLNFETMDDFSPTGIARQIPQLNTMMEVRNLLKDLKARVISNREFRKELEKILKDKSQMEAVMSQLDKIAPMGGGSDQEG
ncbi:MAG: type VI secretion system contractile sheath small subunit [Deltaproteobacteria bacterium]|nr:type VI secretion system contractile sheath small subunit [Deltaproteobacteria bacterium]